MTLFVTYELSKEIFKILRSYAYKTIFLELQRATVKGKRKQMQIWNAVIAQINF